MHSEFILICEHEIVSFLRFYEFNIDLYLFDKYEQNKRHNSSQNYVCFQLGICFAKVYWEI